MDLDKVAKLPNAAFTDVTAPTESAAQAAQDNTVSDNDIFSTREHVENASVFGSGEGAKVAPYAPDAPGNFLSGANGSTVGAPGVKLGDSIGGKTAVEIIDSVFTSLCIALAGYIGYKLNRAELQLTADEKRTIAPAMQAYLNTVNINFNNPLYNLLFVIGSIYAAKIVSVLPGVQPTAKAATKKAAAKVADNYEEDLIKATMRQRKKGRPDAIKFLKSEGHLESYV
jgi:hypothetical protein